MSSGMFLVIDDLALELREHPIDVPIPANVLSDGEDVLRKWTKRVYKRLMKLPYYKWTHNVNNIIIDGFIVRHKKIYPSIST